MSHGGSHGKFAKREGREKDKHTQEDDRPIMVKIAELIEGVEPLEEFCEWKKISPARYQTNCGKNMFSTDPPDEDEECCCCDRIIRVAR